MTRVVLIHWGDDQYLNLAVKQARKYNDVDVIHNILPVPKSTEIDRWFHLVNHMYSNKLDRVVYIDSDVLLFKDVSEDFTDCDMAFSKSHSGHTMFVNNLEALDDFCLYTQRNKHRLELIDKTRERLPGHVFADTMGDMVLLNNFMYDSKYFFRDTYKVYNNSVYDHNINTGTVGWYEDYSRPWRVMQGGEVFDLNSLHFQGGAKETMKKWAKLYLGL